MRIIILNSLFCLYLFGCSSKQPSINSSYATKLSDTISILLKEEKFDEICNLFDNNMRSQLSKEKFAAIWAQLNTQYGKYSGSKGVSQVENLPDIGIRTIQNCQFGDKELYLSLVINNQNKISGIFFSPQKQ